MDERRDYNFHNIYNMGDLNSEEPVYKRNDDWSYVIGEDEYDFGDIDTPDKIDDSGYIAKHPGDYDFNLLLSNLYDYPKKEDMSEEDYRTRAINLRIEAAIDYIIRCAYYTAVNLLGNRIKFVKSELHNPTNGYISFQFLIDIPMNKIYVEWMLNDKFIYVLNYTHIPNRIIGSHVFDDYTKDMIRENLKENTNMWPQVILPDDDGVISYSQPYISPYTIGVYRSINEKYYSIEDRNKVKHHLNIHLDYNEVKRSKFYDEVVKIYNKYKSNNDLPKAFEEYKAVYKDITGFELNELRSIGVSYDVFGI